MVVFKENRVIGFLLQIIAIGFQVKDCNISCFSSCLVEDFRHLFCAAIVLRQWMTYALCGQKTCVDRNMEEEGSFKAGRKKLSEQYLALAGDHVKELCDYCGNLNHKAKGLRCADCLTKLYCGVECQVKDTYHLQSKCERGERRKKKRSDVNRKKEGLKEMSVRNWVGH